MAPIGKLLGPIQPVRNETFSANLIWYGTKFIRIAGEFTYRRTAYSAFSNNEGFGFQTQFQFKF